MSFDLYLLYRRRPNVSLQGERDVFEKTQAKINIVYPQGQTVFDIGKP